MRLRKRYLPLAAVLGLAVAVLPALAAPSEVKLEVNENCVQAAWPCWTTEGSASRPKPTQTVTIAAGGTVAFVDHGEQANIAWTGTAPSGLPTPTCEPSVPVAPAMTKTGWEGKCTFTTPGIYKFESSTMFHDTYEDYRHYEVVVEGSATTPSSGTTTSTPSSTPGTTTPSSGSAGENPTGSPLSGTPTIHSSQHGTTVKGSVQIAKVGAGDRLEVDLIATTASLAKAGHKTQVVGRFVSASVSAGQQSFSVKLNAKARKALKRHHRLALKVKITLTPVYGEAMSVTKSVTLHA